MAHYCLTGIMWPLTQNQGTEILERMKKQQDIIQNWAYSPPFLVTLFSEQQNNATDK